MRYNENSAHGRGDSGISHEETIKTFGHVIRATGAEKSKIENSPVILNPIIINVHFHLGGKPGKMESFTETITKGLKNCIFSKKENEGDEITDDSKIIKSIIEDGKLNINIQVSQEKEEDN